MGARNRTEYPLPWPKYPAVRIALLLSGGIAAAAEGLHSAPLLLALFTLLFTLWSVLESRQPDRPEIVPAASRVWIYLVLILLSGALRHDYRDLKEERNRRVAAAVELYAGEVLRVKGEVTSRFRTSAGRESADLLVTRTRVGEREWRGEYTIRLYGNHLEETGSGIRMGDVRTGDRLVADVRIFQLDPPSNPLEFDYRGWLARQGIYLHGETERIGSRHRAGSRPGWNKLRERVDAKIERIFDDSTSALAKSLLTGNRQDLAPDQRREFSRSGLAHIMAVSGLHVGLIAAPFWLVLSRLMHMKTGKWIGFGLLGLTLLAYAGLAGFSPSVCRAGLMFAILTFGKLSGRPGHSLNLLGASAVVVLLTDPMQLFDIGFQLSYAAVTAILLCSPLLPARNPGSAVSFVRNRIAQVLLISVIVQTGLFPLLAWHFGEFSLIGPLSNLLVFPLLAVFVPSAFLLIALEGLLPEAAASLNQVNRLIAMLIGRIAATLGQWPHGWIGTGISSPLVFLLWIGIAGLAGTIRIPALRPRFLILILAFLNGSALASLSERFRPAELTVVVLDVGQGEAIHVQTPAGKNVLIDTGRWSPHGNSGERVLIPYLRAAGVAKLDAVILTHPHADHIGGMAALLEDPEITVAAILHSGFPHGSRLWARTDSLSQARGVPSAAVSKGDRLDIDPAVRFYILGPDGSVHNSNPNDHSVVVRLVYHETSFLFTGDAQQNQEMRLVRRYGDFLRSDFLKVAHHGSRTSSGLPFLFMVRPEFAAASLAFRNRFGHPHAESMERISAFAGRMDYTSLHGAIRYSSDGSRIVRIRRMIPCRFE